MLKSDKKHVFIVKTHKKFNSGKFFLLKFEISPLLGEKEYTSPNPYRNNVEELNF